MGTALSFDSPAKLDDSYFVRPDVKTLSEKCEKFDDFCLPLLITSALTLALPNVDNARNFHLSMAAASKNAPNHQGSITGWRRCNDRPRCWKGASWNQVKKPGLLPYPCFFRMFLDIFLLPLNGRENQPAEKPWAQELPEKPQRPGWVTPQMLLCINFHNATQVVFPMS